uniref:GTD-binding domain-containing protein n=1 Tax=Kalanchoe fedtschenkoi TaxID=63787 RepID=A0A7N1A8F8_KALFE
MQAFWGVRGQKYSPPSSAPFILRLAKFSSRSKLCTAIFTQQKSQIFNFCFFCFDCFLGLFSVSVCVWEDCRSDGVDCCCVVVFGENWEMIAENNNKLTRVLLHAFLEWVLIFLLLLNSVFSYLIFRFADYFRLKRPCFWCSTIDPLFHHYETRDLVCEHHASQIGRSSAADASSSIDGKGILDGTGRPDDDDINASHDMINHLSYNFNDEASFVEGCSLALKAQNKSTHLIRDLYSEENVVEFTFSEDESVETRSVKKGCDFSVADCCDGYRKIIDHDRLNWGGEPCAVSEIIPLIDDTSCCFGQYESACGVPSPESKGETDVTLIKHTKVNHSECYSIAYTVEGDLVMDLFRNVASAKSTSTTSDIVDTVQEIQATAKQGKDELVPLGLQCIEKTERRVELDTEDQTHDQHEDIPIQSLLLYRTNEHVHEQMEEMAHQLVLSPSPWTEDLVCEPTEETSTPASVAFPSEHKHEPIVEVVAQASPNLPHPNVEELSELQVTRDPEQALHSSLPLSVKDYSNNPLHFSQNDDYDQVEEVMALNRPLPVEATEPCLTVSLGLIQNEGNKYPDTPSSIDGAHNPYKSWLLLDKRESATEESLDGSIYGDFENDEGVLTVNKLKAALKVERKVLHALYAELEEERNASAVAACQTMAMINRLQEEKALVQMEALQYQRVMEEQSEYDQEALQLLNELMVKKDEEKQELERELEIYRKRLTDYETKERLMMMSNRKEEGFLSGSSVSCGNKDTDEASIDLKRELKCVVNGFEHNGENGDHSTPLDDVVNVEESLSHFEEERISILEQLKVLEERLFTLDDGFPCNHDYSCDENGTGKGFHIDVKGDYHLERRVMVPKAKMLLPLFDATVDGNDYGGLSGNENEHDFTSYPHSSSSISEPENTNLCIEEEVDHVYKRLQALEADRDFLRHCFSSLKKGDKGQELLQEILQHLRILRSAEVHD